MEYGKNASESREDVIELLDIVEEGGSSEGRLVELCDILEVGSSDAGDSELRSENGSGGLSFDTLPEIPDSDSSDPDSAEDLITFDGAAPASGHPLEEISAAADEQPLVISDLQVNAADNGMPAPCGAYAAPVPGTLPQTEEMGGAGESHASPAGKEAGTPSLEARLEAVSAEVRELARRVDEMDRLLAQQIADAGSMFLNDVSVRLGIEEMVSRMLDVRFPEGEPAHSPASAGTVPAAGPDSGTASLGVEISAIKERLDMLAAGIEQTAAGAAARVIREEISALKLE